MGLGFGNDCVSGSQGDDDVYNPLGGYGRLTSIANVMMPRTLHEPENNKMRD